MSQHSQLDAPLKITFLGTGTSHGIPVIGCECEVCQSPEPFDKRLRSAVLIDYKNTKIAIDCGPDFRSQMLREKVKHLDALILTHEHRDHIAGLDDIRVFNYKKNGPFDIFCHHRVADNIRQGWSYIFQPNPYPGIPSINFSYIDRDSFAVGELHIEPVKLIHYKLEVLGFRIGNFAYLTDVSAIPDESFEKLKGLKAVVIGALRQTPHISHFSLSQAIEAANKIKADRTYFIHMSHDMGLHHKVQQQLPPNMYLSYDGLQLSI